MNKKFPSMGRLHSWKHFWKRWDSSWILKEGQSGLAQGRHHKATHGNPDTGNAHGGRWHPGAAKASLCLGCDEQEISWRVNLGPGLQPWRERLNFVLCPPQSQGIRGKLSAEGADSRQQSRWRGREPVAISYVNYFPLSHSALSFSPPSEF